jgi:hypothetical protein
MIKSAILIASLILMTVPVTAQAHGWGGHGWGGGGWGYGHGYGYGYGLPFFPVPIPVPVPAPYYAAPPPPPVYYPPPAYHTPVYKDHPPEVQMPHEPPVENHAVMPVKPPPDADWLYVPGNPSFNPSRDAHYEPERPYNPPPGHFEPGNPSFR